MGVGICLNMIVKNESKNLRRLFDSLHEFIDYFVISDTGSNDSTIETVEELSAFYKIPGKVVKHNWVDFAHNRNLALHAAIDARSAGLHNCSWLMIIDADEELKVISKIWTNELNPGNSYTAYKKLGGLSFKHIFLLWIDGQKWQWQGKVHNYISNENVDHRKIFTNGLYIFCHQSEGAKSHRFRNDLEKGFYDVEQLLEELGSAQINGNNVHRYFQLGYALKDINELQKAIFYFKLIADCENASINYRYISSVFAAKYLLVLNETGADIEMYLQKAIKLNQNRKEAYYYLAIYERKKPALVKARSILEKANELPFTNEDNVIMEESICLWKIKYELAFVYFLLHQYKESADIIMQLKNEGHLPLIELGLLDSLLKKMML